MLLNMRLLRFLVGPVLCVYGVLALEGKPPPLPQNELRLYSGLLNEAIPQYGMITLQEFGENDGSASGNTDGLNDGLWCQSTKNITGIGSWIGPDGQVISPLINNNNMDLLYVVNSIGQIGLLHSLTADADVMEGLYKCVIPDENGVNQTLVVFIGEQELPSNLDGNIANGSLIFSHFISQARDSDPPEFALNFSVSTFPPTYITCQVNTSQIEIFNLTREAVITEYNKTIDLVPRIDVSVTLRTRMPGNYQCIVMVFRPGESNLTLYTNKISILVLDPPTMVTGMRTRYDTVELSWAGPAGNAVNYEVFYQISGSTEAKSGADTNTTTNATVDGLMLETTYEFFVVAYSDAENTLPSDHSDNYTVEMNVPQIPGQLDASYGAENVSVSWPTPEFLPSNYTLIIMCHLMCGGLPTPYDNETYTYFPEASSTMFLAATPLPASQCSVNLTAAYGDHFSNTLATPVTLLPQAPRGLEVGLITDTSVSVSLNDLNCTPSHGAISDYVVQYNMVTDADTTLVTVADNHTVIIKLSSLNPCTNYSIRVAAVNKVGESSAFSGPILAMTLPEQVAPGEVADVTYQSSFVDILLNWEAPTIAKGTTLTYNVTYIHEGQKITNTVSETTYNLRGLAPNSMIDVIISAVTACGVPGSERKLTIWTKRIPAPSSFMVNTINSTTVRASWMPGESSDLLVHYTVYYSLDAGQDDRRKRSEDEQEVVFLASYSSGMIGGLMEKTDYLFSIAATYSIDGKMYEGDRTDPISVSTGSEGLLSLEYMLVFISAIVGLLLIVTGVLLFIVSFFRIKKARASRLDQPASSGAQKRRKGNDSHEIMLIGELPTVKELPSSMTVEEGSRVAFKPRITGDPSPSYQWYHENQFAPEECVYEIDARGALTIEAADIKHSGTYTILITNFVGVAEHQISLNVVTAEELQAIDTVGSNKATKGAISFGTVPISEFKAHVAEKHANSDAGFHHAFVCLDSGEESHSIWIGKADINTHFNRFNNIIPYDDNRVTLESIDDLHGHRTGYINASYVNGYRNKKQFIATQGPLKNTIEDFWHMVWQEQAPTIVMVTELVEGNRNKCRQYWPDIGTESYGIFDVTLIDQKVFPSYVTRTLEVELAIKPSNPLIVTQFHYKEWVDHAVPKYSSSLVRMCYAVRESHAHSKRPIITHCSAGVGRTGTFIAIDTLLDVIENEKEVDICGIIVKMRQQRMKMVQTVAQFIFIHDAILEVITCGNTEINAADLRQSVAKLKSSVDEDGRTGLQRQFDVLNEVSPIPEEVQQALAARYFNESDLLLVPYSNSRFSSLGKKATSDYAHPKLISDYSNFEAFIVVKSPMEGMRRNFWKMVVDRECRVIVMLCQAVEGEQKVCAKYWPSHGSVEFGEYIVTLESNTVQNDHYIRQELTVSDSLMDRENSFSVVHFQIVNWDVLGQCSNPQAIISVQEEMYKIQRKTGQKPVVVHCSDTVSRSAMFCAIATIIDQCKTEGAVDVFQTVKSLRIQKPGAVPTLSQYQFIYDTIVAFVGAFGSYSNFS